MLSQLNMEFSSLTVSLLDISVGVIAGFLFPPASSAETYLVQATQKTFTEVVIYKMHGFVPLIIVLSWYG